MNDVSGPGSSDFRSPQSLLRPTDYDRLLENGLTVAGELQKIKQLGNQSMADLTASGELRLTSHMIPVLENPEKALSSTFRDGEERTLRNIIFCSSYLASFDIPQRLIYKPFTYDTESELMVLSNCIWKYLFATSKNPFQLSIR